MIYQAAALLLALFAPLLLVPLEMYLGYPVLLEEVVKFLGVLVLAKYTEGSKKIVLLSLVFGVLFATSETVLYLLNFFSLGNFLLLKTRIIYTSLLHGGTTLLMAIGLVIDHKRIGAYTLFALIVAMIIHTWYNVVFI